MTDIELLRRYRAGSQEAFAELRARHVDWVYSAALRRVRDPHLAEDVTQAVFIALAETETIREGAVMSAWLFRVTRFAASKALREQTRRKRREHVAARPELQAISDTDWSELAPLLDDAVAGLGHKDSQAVLLRFYERKSFVDVGGALGLTEEGARKRVSRAVEKLRHYFAERGYPAAATALVEAMKIHTVSTAPASVAAAQAIAAPSAAALAKDVMSMIKRTRLVRMAAVALGASAAAAGVCIAIAVAAASKPAQAQSEPAKPMSLPAIRIVPSATTLPATQPTSMTIDEVIAGLQTAEKEFTNLYIKDFRTTIEVMHKGEIEWKPSPMVDAGSAWFDGDALGKQRVYFSENVMRWERGPGDLTWSGAEVDFSWDGRDGHQVNVTGGVAGQRPLRDNTAMITPDRPPLLGRYARYRTGAAFTLQYWVTNEEQDASPKPRQLLSEQLAAGAAKGHAPELSQQVVNGFDTVRLRWKFPGNSDSITYWLAPSRGFAIVKEEEVLDASNEWRVEGMNVYTFKEAAKGAWFPVRADRIGADGEPGEYWRYTFTAADAVANDPKFDPSIFRAAIPVGYNVNDDRRHDRRFYVQMPDGSEQEIHAGEALPRVKVQWPRRPDAKD